MANLSVRKIDDTIVDRLRERAAKNGVSMEEEARQILTQAVMAPERMGDLALSLFGESNGVDLEIPRRTTHEPLDLS